MSAHRFPRTALTTLATLIAAAASGASFTVDDETDAVDAVPGDGVCATSAGSCTLRAAIQESNALPGHDVVQVPAGLFLIQIPGGGEDAAATGDLDVDGDLTILGAGPDDTWIDGDGLDRVLQVGVGAAVELFDLTIQHGWRPPEELGGGVYNDGELVVDGCRIRENEAWLAGGIANFGTLWVLRSEILDNECMTLGNLLGGGGIGNAGTLFVEDSTIRGNTTLGTGGGIGTFGATEVTRTTIDGNHAVGNGGGIVSVGGTLTIANSTISGNASDESGGGISAPGEVASLSNVTIANNVADADANGSGDGGGLRGGGSTLLANTIVADNVDTGGEAPDCAGGLASAGYNLIEDTASCTIGGDTTGNVTGQPAELWPLGWHGGPTRTHALRPASPAVDAGSPGATSACEADDQRGYARSWDGDGDGIARCDIGAFELPEPRGLATRIAGALCVLVLARRRRASTLHSVDAPV